VKVEKLELERASFSLPVALASTVPRSTPTDAKETGERPRFRRGPRAHQGAQDPHPQVQEQDRLPQAQGHRQPLTVRQGHRISSRVSEPLAHKTGKGASAHAMVATPTPRGWPSSASACRSPMPARSIVATRQRTSTLGVNVGRGDDDKPCATVLLRRRVRRESWTQTVNIVRTVRPVV